MAIEIEVRGFQLGMAACIWHAIARAHHFYSKFRLLIIGAQHKQGTGARDLATLSEPTVLFELAASAERAATCDHR